MNTRRVQSGERRRQNGWASASEYDVLRGLNGTAVAFKATLQDDPKARELLYGLQASSLREGGLKRMARELVEMFPERIGTPTMHAIGCKPGKRLTREQCRAIHGELFPEDYESYWSTRVLLDEGADDANDCTADLLETEKILSDAPAYVRTADQFQQDCLNQAEGLHRFIEELCCNPKLEVSRADASNPSYRRNVELILEDAREVLAGDSKLARERPHLQTAIDSNENFGAAEVPYFRDVLGALYEYQRHQIEQARASYAATSIGNIVFEAADYALETGRSALVEGNSGFGKTTALKAWCEMHPGRVRYLQLPGIMDATVFFKRLAKVCGVANGTGLSAGKIQARVEDFLQRSKLLLVIDEGQYLWPQGRRITAHPKFINWLNTACYNEGVPFLISATQEFTLRRQVVESQTEWSSEQSRRRIRKVFPLPDAPTEADLQIVARKLLPGFGKAAVDYVVSYAQVSRGYFQTITDAIEDAQLIARRAGRAEFTAKDLITAVKEWRAPSDAALQRVFTSKAEGRRRVPATVPAPAETAPDEPEVNEPLIAPSRAMQNRLSSPAAGRRLTLPEAAPVLTG